jgi:hypothetical protein
VEPGHIESALAWLDAASALIGADTDGARRDAVRGLRRQLRKDLDPRTAFPWEAGWIQAKRVRSLVGVDSSGSFSIDSYVSSRHRELDDRGLLAAGGSVERSNPVVVVGRRRIQPLRRFTLARALWHYLWDEDNSLFLVTTSYTDRQKIERAFAAELLAPADGISQLLDLSPESASAEDVEQVADHFEVSPMVVEHQLNNQLLSA